MAGLLNAERPHSALDGRAPAEAYETSLLDMMVGLAPF